MEGKLGFELLKITDTPVIVVNIQNVNKIIFSLFFHLNYIALSLKKKKRLLHAEVQRAILGINSEARFFKFHFCNALAIELGMLLNSSEP